MACYGYGMHFLKQRLSQAALHGEVILRGIGKSVIGHSQISFHMSFGSISSCHQLHQPTMLQGL
jgi:hypothetical protein